MKLNTILKHLIKLVKNFKRTVIFFLTFHIYLFFFLIHLYKWCQD